MKLYQLRYLLNMDDDEELEVEWFEKVYPNGRTYSLRVKAVEAEETDQ